MRAPRWFHQFYAKAGGYFWAPCPNCGRYFGGHEHREDPAGHIGSVWTWTQFVPGPTPVQELICAACTAKGVGCRSHADAGQYHSFDCEFAPAPRS
jgi:hypothetical protein